MPRNQRTVTAVLGGYGLFGALSFILAATFAPAFPWAVADGIGQPAVTCWPAPFDPSDPPALRLAVAGDVGTGGDAEFATAAAMAHRENEQEFDALILLGDNVYPHGDPDRLDETVFVPFGDVLFEDTALLAVLGNHDVQDGHGDEQARRLGMPGRWYAHRLGDLLFLGLDSNRADDSVQRHWLERVLANVSARWVIAALHHPPYSAGSHGSHRKSQAAFAELFAKYDVDLVLSGHDHDYQRSSPIDGVVYVTSGGAARLRPAGRRPFTATSWWTYHFVELNVWADRLEIRAIDQQGMVFDEATIWDRPADQAAGAQRPPVISSVC